jgi:hypothetical protein
MPKNKPKSYGVYLESELINSNAFLSLNGKAVHFYLVFLQRRRFVFKKIGKRKVKDCVNKDEIVFTYAEGEAMGFPRATFKRLQECLIERGFLDIVETGAGYARIPNIYSLSERWKKYGTPGFVASTNPSRGMVGFKKGHAPYGNQNKIITENGNR